MPRSAVDATRFTASHPHVYAKSTSPQPPSAESSSQSLPRSPQPPTSTSSRNGLPTGRKETPQEKVARLRAMRQAQRTAELPLWERTIIRGRRIADRAHRVTTLGLVAASIGTMCICGFAVSDMLLYNRRKRDAFYEQQHRIYTSKLLAAIETEKAGIQLTNDQQLVLNRERLKVAQDEIKLEQKWSTKIKRSILGDLKREDKAGPGSLLIGDVPLDGRVPTEGEVLELLGVDKMQVLKESKELEKSQSGSSNVQMSESTQQVVKKELDSTMPGLVPRPGGVLDQMAENLYKRAAGR